MADISMSVTAGSAPTGSATVPTVASNVMTLSLDNNNNPLSLTSSFAGTGIRAGTVDMMAELERLRIEYLDYFGDL